jgi:hypothetical protein
MPLATREDPAPSAGAPMSAAQPVAEKEQGEKAEEQEQPQASPFSVNVTEKFLTDHALPELTIYYCHKSHGR